MGRSPGEEAVTVPGRCAELYDSQLAAVAWRGLEQGIFSHSCAVVSQRPENADGTGDLIEVALVSEAEAACPGARVLRHWEA